MRVKILLVAILILFSFSAARYTRFPIKAYSFKWYEQLFANDALIDALIRSTVLGVLCGLTTTLLGFLAAYCLARYEYSRRTVPGCSAHSFWAAMDSCLVPAA